MNTSRLGRGLRAIRIRANHTQAEVARRAGVPRAVVGRAERGDVARLRVEQLVAIAAALHGDVDVVLRWRGSDLDRLLAAGHSAMHELVVGILITAGWEVVPERSFSKWGERGVIDILGWHAPTRTLLIVELKTEIVDVQRLIGPQIAAGDWHLGSSRSSAGLPWPWASGSRWRRAPRTAAA